MDQLSSTETTQWGVTGWWSHRGDGWFLTGHQEGRAIKVTGKAPSWIRVPYSQPGLFLVKHVLVGQQGCPKAFDPEWLWVSWSPILGAMLSSWIWSDFGNYFWGPRKGCTGTSCLSASCCVFSTCRVGPKMIPCWNLTDPQSTWLGSHWNAQENDKQALSKFSKRRSQIVSQWPPLAL